MDERVYKQAMYQSFFEELGSIEKNAMIQKEALNVGQIADAGKAAWGAVKGFGGRALSGARELGREGVGGVRRSFTEGALKAPAEAGAIASTLSGAGNVLGTDAGKALAVGAGGLAAGGAGLTGLGYMAGRGRRPLPQPLR